MSVEVSPMPVMAKDGKHVTGFIQGRVFRKKLNMSNMLNSPPGWTLESWLLDFLPRYGVSVIQVFVTDAPSNKNLWVTSLQKFIDYGLDVNRGTGPHRALAEGYWLVMANR